jgi:hypothetical protein
MEQIDEKFKCYDTRTEFQNKNHIILKIKQIREKYKGIAPRTYDYHKECKDLLINDNSLDGDEKRLLIEYIEGYNRALGSELENGWRQFEKEGCNC